MGNKLRRRRQVVHERSTMPQRLYAHNDVDIKNPEKLMLESKLAPCYSGDEECRFDHEECPICFLDYPSLNRSRCCTQGICTECFLQIKNPISARLTQCPFCKTSNYAVEDRGVKTKQEKALEQIEEQRVIEAKIRMRQREIQVEQNMQKRQELTTSSSIVAAGTSYESSNVTDDNTGEVNVAGSIVPESYEEQMMLAVCFFRRSSCDDKWTSWQ